MVFAYYNNLFGNFEQSGNLEELSVLSGKLCVNFGEYVCYLSKGKLFKMLMVSDYRTTTEVASGVKDVFVRDNQKKLFVILDDKIMYTDFYMNFKTKDIPEVKDLIVDEHKSIYYLHENGGVSCDEHDFCYWKDMQYIWKKDKINYLMSKSGDVYRFRNLRETKLEPSFTMLFGNVKVLGIENSIFAFIEDKVVDIGNNPNIINIEYDKNTVKVDYVNDASMLYSIRNPGESLEHMGLTLNPKKIN